MKKQYLVVANWKLRLNFDETINFAGEFYDDFIELSSNSKITIVLCPEAISIYPMVNIFKQSLIEIGAQNCSEHLFGAYTGDVSAISIRNVGCKHCIVGHSERRQHHFETSEKVSMKVEHVLDYALCPIICIGETKEVFESKKTFDYLKKQLDPVLEAIKQNMNLSENRAISIAYEPIWSIGTGDVASIEHINNVFAWIKEQFVKACVEVNWKILYGGSVTSENIDQLKQIDGINGFLIGNASLDFQEFKKIVDSLGE